MFLMTKNTLINEKINANDNKNSKNNIKCFFPMKNAEFKFHFNCFSI